MRCYPYLISIDLDKTGDVVLTHFCLGTLIMLDYTYTISFW